jgi:hypothetical protein
MGGGGDGARTRGKGIGATKNLKNYKNQAIKAWFSALDEEVRECGLTEYPTTMIYGEVDMQL